MSMCKNSKISHQYNFSFHESEPFYSKKRKFLNRREKFLLDTLVLKNKMRSQKSTIYFTVRHWREAEKNRQLLAMRSAKREPSRDFVDAIASEMSHQVEALIGIQNFDCIVPMPGGNSKSRGFSCKIAEAMALQTRLEKIDAFETIVTNSRSSHPINNSNRQSIRLKTIPGPRVLLVDDVASSGQHMFEATTVLRKHCDSTIAMAWIGK